MTIALGAVSPQGITSLISLSGGREGGILGSAVMGDRAVHREGRGVCGIGYVAKRVGSVSDVTGGRGRVPC